ncbi:MAG: hypothetical protein K6U74_11235, partial [Firmicutes bacterium]|nr:hypothetical protein [Bacillota bacterium]
YPSWEGIRPWLRSVLAGVVLGFVLWLVIRFAGFMERVDQAGVSIGLTDLMALTAPPAVLLAVAARDVGRIFSWSFSKSSGVWWRTPACVALVAVSSLCFVIGLSAVSEF